MVKHLCVRLFVIGAQPLYTQIEPMVLVARSSFCMRVLPVIVARCASSQVVRVAMLLLDRLVLAVFSDRSFLLEPNDLSHALLGVQVVLYWPVTGAGWCE